LILGRYMSKFVFGPLQSRRFGLSLGIDLSPEKKTCNFDCVYCELEPAKTLTNIENPSNVNDIIIQVKEALVKYPKIDVITITANGEPTLYPMLGELIDHLNQIKKEKKLLILSNASTIVSQDIQNSLCKLDIVKLSLDCVSEKCFKKIDRPDKSIDFNKMIESIISFRKIFKNELVIEILVVEGINDKEEEFKLLNQALQKINPDRVDIGTIDRPPAYAVKPVSEEKISKLATLIENIPVSIVRKKKSSQTREPCTNT
jgi:wyosine [tRNA(Phe)-imidazoG37] synthetase (radical SAM superfamily)